MERQEGYYWVKVNESRPWEIHYFKKDGYWNLTNDEDHYGDYEDSYFLIINENRILSPDEINKKFNPEEGLSRWPCEWRNMTAQQKDEILKAFLAFNSKNDKIAFEPIPTITDEDKK